MLAQVLVDINAAKANVFTTIDAMKAVAEI